MKESHEPRISQALTLNPGDLVLLGRRARVPQACAFRENNLSRLSSHVPLGWVDGFRTVQAALIRISSIFW